MFGSVVLRCESSAARDSGGLSRVTRGRQHYAIRLIARSFADRLRGLTANSSVPAEIGFLVSNSARPAEASSLKAHFTRASSSE